MQNISVVVAALSACVCALGGNLTYVPRDVLPRFPTGQDREIYFLSEGKKPNNLCSVYFRCDTRDNCVPSPVSLLRFVYDETEAKAHFQEADARRRVSVHCIQGTASATSHGFSIFSA
ncbi:MAG: uncharacterized protein A8A55_3553, partial [Amphiamblys sp. WSBS2006]